MAEKVYFSWFVDTQDVDLDAILGELCALENEYEEAIRTTNVATRKSGTIFIDSSRYLIVLVFSFIDVTQ